MPPSLATCVETFPPLNALPARWRKVTGFLHSGAKASNPIISRTVERCNARSASGAATFDDRCFRRSGSLQYNISIGTDAPNQR